MKTVMSDISYLALLNRTTTGLQLRDSIWKSLSFNVENMTMAFEENTKLETEMRKNLVALEKMSSEKDSSLEAVKSTSAIFMRDAARMYSIMQLNLRGHLQILPQLDKMANVLVESVIVGRDKVSYDRFSRQYEQVIERAIGDLNKITEYIVPMQQQTEVALEMIHTALDATSKQKKSGETQKYIGGAAVGMGAGFFTVGTASSVQLVLTGAAILGNPILTIGLMATGTLIGAGGFAAYTNGQAIQVDAIDLTKGFVSGSQVTNQLYPPD
ncbi:unnamed protein product [Adineta steineri]|uniref:Uncharacterized protein n=1 Tax=Adineta steineri TaxID=433720 RepID=A0A819G2Q0_9BILA|nr:unnamed protein product [Adineta steineri]CAF1203575.1 unnamed protein product [Adineta steineri]CAF1269814.1 unnamed protein product [Adineta steineri]CAF3594687.1 unnamed protein product [Adineta steineri]CAF3879214.1 unnamed protein product [Adineta steineri]